MLLLLLFCSLYYSLRLFSPTHRYRVLSMSRYDMDSLNPGSAFSSTGEDLVWQGLRKDAFEGGIIHSSLSDESSSSFYSLHL